MVESAIECGALTIMYDTSTTPHAYYAQMPNGWHDKQKAAFEEVMTEVLHNLYAGSEHMPTLVCLTDDDVAEAALLTGADWCEIEQGQPTESESGFSRITRPGVGV